MGETPAMIAASFGQDKVLLRLIALGVDYQVTDKVRLRVLLLLSLLALLAVSSRPLLALHSFAVLASCAPFALLSPCSCYRC